MSIWWFNTAIHKKHSQVMIHLHVFFKKLLFGKNCPLFPENTSLHGIKTNLNLWIPGIFFRLTRWMFLVFIGNAPILTVKNSLIWFAIGMGGSWLESLIISCIETLRILFMHVFIEISSKNNQYSQNWLFGILKKTTLYSWVYRTWTWPALRNSNITRR